MPVNGFLSDVFDAPDLHGAALIAAKTAVVFLVLVVGLRLLGKRELGQMTIVDLVLIVILGNAVQNAMLNGDNTLAGGVVSVTILLGLNRALAMVLARSGRLERLLAGEPVVLVSEGRVNDAALRRQGVTGDQLLAALREHGVEDLGGVRLAVLEVDGTISVVPVSSSVIRTRRHFRGVRLP
jgi:uncharacterized membrane protein YcaP (DUF421 family)